MGNEATQDVNKDRIKTLDAFFERIWKDGSFVHWVNPKTQKLNVKKVANEIVNSSDPTIFSKWAKKYRDGFNEKYKQWRISNGTLSPDSEIDGQFLLPMEEQESDKFLDDFVNSESVTGLGELDEDALKSLLNTYQNLSCERYLVAIDKLKEKVKSLEAQVARKEKTIALQAEAIEHAKTYRETEDAHFKGSVRNLYEYPDP